MINLVRRIRWYKLVSPGVTARQFSAQKTTTPIIKIENATFYKQYPVAEGVQRDNPPLYPNLSFALSLAVGRAPGHFNSGEQQEDSQPHWAIIGSSGRSELLEILCGQHICIPPTARSYPLLATEEISVKNPRLRFPGHAIRHVGFGGEAKRDTGGVRGSYLSARYESRREDTDFTVLQFLKGQILLNPLEGDEDISLQREHVLNQVIADLGLQKLLDIPLSNLSNGQTRRARIARALLQEPEVLLLDDPFMGLDPPTVKEISPLLYKISKRGSPRLIISLRPQDDIPSWISHLIILGPNHTVALQGEKGDVLKQLDIWKAVMRRRQTSGSTMSNSRLQLLPRTEQDEKQYKELSVKERQRYDEAEGMIEDDRFGPKAHLLHDLGIVLQGSNSQSKRAEVYGEAIVEMEGVKVSYGHKTVLGGWDQMIDGRRKEGLFWEIRRGQRWGVFGLNGSGKTTLLSLITSDHPQSYSSPLRLFGRSRLPEAGKPGVSLFDLQSRIGHSSPEIHAFFPRNLSVRASIESAWADTFLSQPRLDQAKNLDVNSVLGFFEADLNNNLCEKEDHSLASPRYSEHLWANSEKFSSLDFAQQRLVLFLRAIVHRPDLVILDEAFSGMPRLLRDKCLHFLEVGETLEESTGTRRISETGVWGLPASIGNPKFVARYRGLTSSQALIIVSHLKEEIPGILSHWMRLPTAVGNEMRLSENSNKSSSSGNFKIGTLKETQTVSKEVWDEIWA